LDPSALPPEVLAFLDERHLATLTTLRPDGSPHVVAVAFTWDDGARLVRVITGRDSRKARNVAPGGTRAVVAQVDGARWLALEGVARLVTDREAVREGERRYGLRYRQPQDNPDRAVVEIAVDRVLGRG
ncbi:MAG: TIGR03618 family F420-dependent PPOX class oxidoreductase, partial [Acidimicrobiales bacterium]